MFGLSADAFDQDLQGGWRELAARPGCKADAADLISRYRQRQEARITSLYWHEGQLRAELDQRERAIAAFEKSRHKDKPPEWDAYVDATIAFLKHDKPALLAARERLATMPRPPDDQWADINGKPLPPPSWPPNLDVVDGLIACFGKGYDEAYGAACRGQEDGN